MELRRITMDPGEARKAYREHRGTLGRKRNEEDALILSGYRALARGLDLISLSATLAWGGVDERGLPRLAVCRADARFAYTQGVMLDGSATFRMDRVGAERASSRQVRLPAGTFPRPRKVGWHTYSAMVPLIPRPLRPSGRLGGYHILWDVSWTLAVPEDPALLQHVGSDLYAVVAVWELTELERAVLSQRLRQRQS